MRVAGSGEDLSGSGCSTSTELCTLVGSTQPPNHFFDLVVYCKSSNPVYERSVDSSDLVFGLDSSSLVFDIGEKSTDETRKWDEGPRCEVEGHEDPHLSRPPTKSNREIPSWTGEYCQGVLRRRQNRTRVPRLRDLLTTLSRLVNLKGDNRGSEVSH